MHKRFGRLEVLMKKRYLLSRIVSHMVIVAGLVVGLVPVAPVKAITSNGLDYNEFGNWASYVLSDTCDVRGATHMAVPIYFDSNPGSVTVRVTVSGSENGGSLVANGGIRIGGGQQNVTVANMTYDSSTGKYMDMFVADLAPGNGCAGRNYGRSINFRLDLLGNQNNVAQGVIGYSKDNSAQFAVANQGRCDPSPGDRSACGWIYYNYSLPFAPPCSQASGTARVEVFDGDNPRGSTQENVQPSPFSARVVDVTTGNTAPNYNETGSWSDGQTRYLNFNFDQGHKYRLELNGVYTNNVLQFHLPFDSIYSQIQCYSYNITPSSSVGVAKAFPGITVQFDGNLTNGGGSSSVTTNSQRPTYYSYLHMTYPKNAPVPGGIVTIGAGGGIDCSNYAGLSGAAGSCQAGGSGSLANGINANQTVSSSSGNFARDPITVPANAQIGSRVCSVIVVSPASADVPGSIINNARASAPVCITVVAPPISPEVQIWGYDARVGQKVSTSLLIQAPGMTGSWSEYGVLSGSNNSNFASGRGLDGPVSNFNQGSWSNFTFANSNVTDANCSTSHFGCYGTVSYPSQLVTALRARCTSWNNGTAASPYPINGGSYSSTQFICVNGTARIGADIATSDAPTSNPTGLPQVVIIADNIIIDPGVRNVNAWLIAGTSATTGNVSTCSTMKTGSGASTNYFPNFNAVTLGNIPGALGCPTPLTVTGPVVANKLYLFRTTDSGKVGNPAEIFNLRADAFLWAYGGGGASGTPYAQTTSIQELPPRF